MTITGEKLENFKFPACSKFRPEVLRGELCYTLDLSTILDDDVKTGSGKENGIMFLVDPGELTTKEEVSPLQADYFSSLNMAQNKEEYGSISLSIHTLAHFSDHREGSYMMTSLKKMTGTKNFLNLPEKQKKCQIQRFEECQTEKFLERVQKECGCKPWRINSALDTKQVRTCWKKLFGFLPNHC